MKRKVAFITFGCSLNQADSEAMMGLLKNEGFEIVGSADKADIVVVNTCTVKNLAEAKFFKALKELELKRKKVVVAGCIPQADKQTTKEKLSSYSILGTSQLDKIVHVVQERLEGNVVQLLDKKKLARLSLPKIRRNKIIDIIPICEGCLGSCTYCKTKQARGDLISYPVKDIVRQVEEAVKDGCKEIWLTSQDCGTYGKDIGTDLVELLEKVLAVEGDFMVRVGMSNPNHVMGMMDRLIKIYKNKKLFKFLHVPVQSGNDDVLKAMNRFYTISDYKKIIKTFKNEIPDITISTDIICGFPGETREQFLDSVKLIKETKPDVLNISRYWARPGTKAAAMKQVIGWETKNRSTELKNEFDKVAFQENQRWLGWTGTILIDEKGKDDSFVGRNQSYKPIVVKGKYELGQIIEVKIKKANEHYLVGEEV
ncbi:MAG: tRNA (N(6)-L-threonylcarbamoyladenosine(37)-C(2))-methylthiotransferase [Nanoarchaeota archaeon]|nr:tRNA (N(6)-L-threonylcarbamoyladenosine(37)-C(2))-methylthiotransferase [Nanoarchaeota archaeon]